MAGRVDGKVALVTGAASGIGRGCAERLAEEGAICVLTDRQDEMGREVAAGIQAAGGRAEFLSHDVTDEDAWIGVMGALESRHGRLDVIVNNAGIAITSPVDQMSLADWKRQVAVNLDGVFLGVKYAVRLMKQGGRGGSIINISSTAGMRGSPQMSGYSATKGGVRLFTKAVAVECARDKIRVNSVHPGVIETAIWASIGSLSDPSRNAPPDLDEMSERIVPLRVKGLPRDIANGVLWLASDESRYVTGTELVIDGALSIR
jgi:NAD(P)-dependent dehydrogenase (short-subunit alcohol dehydrogenase family)